VDEIHFDLHSKKKLQAWYNLHIKNTLITLNNFKLKAIKVVCFVLCFPYLSLIGRSSVVFPCFEFGRQVHVSVKS
jgi:hypothetical protein